ncbi:MAG: S41 family peptidase [Ignavibacteria bacterium]|jgi:hypothetical protein
MKTERTILSILVFVFAANVLSQVNDALISREKLIQDIRQLVNILETAHPDPYIKGGGKIAFHRRIYKIMNSIPAEGLNLSEFGKMLSPIFVSIGDGHTRINRTLSSDSLFTKIIPVKFRAIEKELYIAKVYEEQHRYLLGSKLIAVQGIPYDRLIERMYSLQPIENTYYAMKMLCRFINDKRYYKELLPEWKDRNNIMIKIKLASGKIEEVSLTTKEKLENPIQQPTKIEIPSIEKSSIAYNFLDKKKKIALLRIFTMNEYREHFEGVINEIGSLGPVKDVAEESYERFNTEKAPSKDEDIVSGLPSVVELFIKLLEEMKSAGSENLLIDLRGNTGGDDSMSAILLYFLYGKKGIENTNQGIQVVKYSDFYFSFAKEVTLESINKDRIMPLEKNDYDFSGEAESNFEITKEDLLNVWSKYKAMAEELKTGRHEKFYCPKNVIVICDEVTFSAGFDMMRDLYYNGATIVGVPSSQAGNSFGNIIMWKLANSGIEGSVSYKYDLSFPNDPVKGEVLTPHYVLTYKKLAEYGFDPNSSIRYALELLPMMNKKTDSK